MASLMLDSSGSEDEFPDVKEIVRRHKTSNNTNNKSILSTTSSSSTTTKSSSITNNAPRLLAQDHNNINNNNNNNNKENLLPPSPKPQLKATSMSPMKGQATPGMRRRKLGLAQSQAVDGSLFGRWEGGGSGGDPAPQTARKAATGSRARMIREASVATASTTTTAEDHSSISNTNNNNNNSIMSFGSAVTAGTTNTSSSRTARTLFRKKSRPRLEIDDSFDEEDEDDAVVSRRKARSVRPPTRFRDMLKATQPVSGLDSDSDSNDNDNDNDGSDFALGKSSAGEGEDSSEFDSFGQRSRGDSSRSTLDSELFSTPPKRRTAKPPGTARRVLRPAKTAASVDPMLGRKEPATSRKPSRSVSAKGGAAAPPPKERRGKTPAAAAGGKAAKQDGLEDAFQKLKIFNDNDIGSGSGSGSDADRKAKGSNQESTMMSGGDDNDNNSDPATPRRTGKTLPPSPHKTPRIPLSPWKPDNKEFWDPEVNFAWIDEHSPAKQPTTTTKPPGTAKKIRARLGGGPKLEPGGGVPFPSAFSEEATTRNRGSSPAKTKREQREARRAFDEAKDALARDFLAELDDRITHGRLGKLTAASGGLRTKWSNTLQTTAGRAHWRCKTVTTTRQGGEEEEGAGREQQHEAHIELASKVLTNEADLLNTVAHEFCHLAVFMLHHDPQDKKARKPAAHGPEFKAFGRRCGAAFGHRGIEVTTRHSYDIEYRYAWRCADCLTEVHRHSRSVDPRKHRCGRCRGVLEQIRPVPRGAAAAGADAADASATKSSSSTATKRQPSAWQEFLSAEMKALSGAAGKGMSFENKMEIVSGKWKKQKQENGSGSGSGAKDKGRATKAKAKGEDDGVADVTDAVKAVEIVDLADEVEVDVVRGDADANSDEDDDVVEVSSSSG